MLSFSRLEGACITAGFTHSWSLDPRIATFMYRYVVPAHIIIA
jgi:hypothetical protein